MKTKLNAISAAALLAIAAAVPAHAGLERFGPPATAPTAGGFPAWFQDHTGITVEFCDLTSQAEWDGGWCVLAPPDGPVGGLPEVFPDNFFEEHFYFLSDNVMLDPANALKARLVLALEATQDGGHSVFARHRIDIRPLPFDGDYRVITPFADTTYFDQVAGARIFDTQDIGIGCPETFECTLDGSLGPFLLPSATAGGSEVPAMPDLISAPPGTDPFYDQLVAAGGATPSPGTGKQYLADPGRVGPVTGSPLPDVQVFEPDATGATHGIPSVVNHNIFRVEVRNPSPTHDGAVFYTLDGTTNFTIGGRLMTGNLPGRVGGGRAVYRADSTGKATDVDVFTTASPTVQARIPTQPVQGVVKPALAFYPVPCGGALTTDPLTGNVTVNPGPYTAPAGVQTSLANDDGGTDYWGQVAVTGAPPSHVCVVDTTARNAAGQLAPAYSLKAVTDDVVVKTAAYDGPNGGTLAITAESSDPTARLMLAGFGSALGPDGAYVGRGTGSNLVANAATVRAIKSPPNQVQVVSSKGGTGFHTVQTARGMSVTAGQTNAGNDTAVIFEDCSATGASSCAPGQGLTLDLLANDTVFVNGAAQNLRALVQQGTTVNVHVLQTARLGVATVSADGILTYVPNPNANGTDGITYTVSVNGGPASDPAVVTITVTPVNDPPVAAPVTINAVQATAMTLNLIANATDPDGPTDVKNAVITAWPPQLGTQPVPVNGVITFTPATTGNFAIGFNVVDAAGAQSATAVTGTVTVIASETIAITRAQFEAGKNRWRVDGTDTIRASQTISITYTNGTLSRGPNAGQTCDGTASLPECTIGTTGVTATGAFSLDSQFGNAVFQNPATAGGWSVLPTAVRAWSSNPVLGGGATLTFTRK
jgi:hypothetical protein